MSENPYGKGAGHDIRERWTEHEVHGIWNKGYNQAIEDALALRKPMIDLGNRLRLEALCKKVSE